MIINLLFIIFWIRRNVRLNFFLNRFTEIRCLRRCWLIAQLSKISIRTIREKSVEVFVLRWCWELSHRQPFGGFASLRSQRRRMRRYLDAIPHHGDTPLRGIPYAPSIFMGPSTYCQTYWALANGRGHARNSWIFKQVTKQSSFALAPAPGTDTPSGHQAVPYYLIAYWAEMELSYSVQLRARARMPKAICDRETPEENLTLSLE